MIRSALTLLVALGLAACASEPGAHLAANTCQLVRLAEVSLEARGNMLFVQARIGKAPVTLLLDTGAERTLLTEAAVDRLRLTRDFQHATRTFGIGSPTATWDALLPNGMVLGGAYLAVNSVTVGHFGMDLTPGALADGLLGADILLAFDIDLDLPAHRMTLYRARPECPEETPPWNEPFVKVAGISTRRDRLLVPFELDSMGGLAVLDTGAQVSSISERMVERIGLVEDDMAQDRTVMAHGAAPDQVAVHIHLFHELRVGSLVMRDPALPVVPMSSSMGDALLGADFLQGRRVWLSLSKQQVFVTPLEHGPWLAVTQTAE
jgi:predicted aspartyl protease